MGFDNWQAVRLLWWIWWGLRKKTAGWVAALLWVSVGSAEDRVKGLSQSQILNVLWLLSCGICVLLTLWRWILSYWTVCDILCLHWTGAWSKSLDLNVPTFCVWDFLYGLYLPAFSLFATKHFLKLVARSYSFYDIFSTLHGCLKCTL